MRANSTRSRGLTERLIIHEALILWVSAACFLGACGSEKKSATSESTGGNSQAADSRQLITGLSIDPSWPALSPGSTGREPLKAGGGVPVAGWTYAGHAGDLVTVTAKGVEPPPRLILAESSTGALRVVDMSPSGQGDTAQVSAELPRDGTYYVLAAGDKEQGGKVCEVRFTAEAVPDFGGTADSRGRFALLVGIGDYPGAQYDLPGIGNDLDLFRRLLIDTYGWKRDDILVLRDHEATRRRVMNAFLQHLGRAGQDGVAVFYYSGHGRRLSTNIVLTGALDPEPDGKDEALFLADGKILVDDEIGSLADRLPAERVLLVLDSCYSGTGARGGSGWIPKRVSGDLKVAEAPEPVSIEGGSPPSPEGAEPGASDGRQVLLAAAQENQLAGEVKGLPGITGYASAFTYHLTSILSSARGDITFEALTDSVVSRTLQTAQSSDVEDQTPRAGGDLLGRRVADFLAKRP